MNKNLFNSASSIGKNVPIADTTNNAGGKAYSMTEKHELAQAVVTGCFGSTYYVSAENQLDRVLKLCENLPAKFVAQAAVYARENGLMKDAPALLCAVLAQKDVELLKAVFTRVIDNGKMLRNFVTIMRSGKAGRTSFGTSVKKLVQKWFDSRSDEQLFRDSVGEEGASIADCIKLCHPAPRTSEREAFYAYLIGKKVVSTKKEMVKNEKTGRNETVLLKALPSCVQAYETYKNAVLAGKDGGELPNVEWRLLTALNLSDAEWKKIAEKAPYQMTRMNLNTFERHGVLKDDKMVDVIAKRLADADALKKARVFPYQLFTAYKNVGDNIPAKIVNALQDAAELSIDNVPEIKGKVYIMIDCSGSMHSPITGNRGTVSSKMSCLDVASLFAASLMRKNPEAEVIAFNTQVVPCKLNGRDSIMTNAGVMAKLPQGGTTCSAPLKMLNDKGAKGDVCIMISDNESWADMHRGTNESYSHFTGRGTCAAAEWAIFKKKNPSAKFIALDLTPNSSMQVKDQKDVLNIGGFSDSVFSIIGMFAKGEMDGQHFSDVIEAVDVSVESSVEVSAKKGAEKATSKKRK